MNSLFVILSSLLTVALCQDQGCCLPAKLTANEGLALAEVVDGKPRIITGSIGLSMDDTIRMVNSQIFLIIDQKQMTERVLQDYNTKTQYLIQNGGCTKTPLADWKPHCLTKNDTFMGNLYFGSSTASLDASNYRVVAGDITAYVTVTREKSCVPIGEWAFGQSQGVPLSMTLGFTNVTRSIPDPSVFHIPAICRTAPLIDQAPILRGSYLFR